MPQPFTKGRRSLSLFPALPAAHLTCCPALMAPYLEKYTGARTLMQNSRNIQAQNTLVRSKPDGLTVVLSGHGPKEITAQLFKQEGVSFDWTKFTLLGRIPSSSTAFVRRQENWVGKNRLTFRAKHFSPAPAVLSSSRYLPRRWVGIKCRSFPACQAVKGHWRCAGVKFRAHLEALPRSRRMQT